ncbi:hypothetical protein E2F43_03480 [Seongchinamella unica]|uniref:Fe2OG dioxygenase domain-containing protein n=1 Tax=Seongchinamella unica TaxID=2547392 RepID=A0A4R5LVQ0_9GAMM|nr:TIGR02466 family protein [Seongchinamella unica]TDG15308.1 hypothetical protein E2F43_03480 [Seongchinamella unica]
MVAYNTFTLNQGDSCKANLREQAIQMVNAVTSHGESQFVAEVAAEPPLIVILELLRVPLQDRRQCRPRSAITDLQHGTSVVVEIDCMLVSLNKVPTRYPEQLTRGKCAAMFSKGEIKTFFPSCVWIHELQEFRDMNASMIAELGELRKSTGYTNPGNGAWQSRGNLNKLPTFEPLMECFTAGSRRVLEFLKYEFENFVITDAWANINPPGHSHVIHTHPNNFLSGVYYLQAPEGCGDIEFIDPRQQALVLQPRATVQTPQNAWKQRIPPREGQLLIFNSWFQHQVQENRSDQERISISFNIMLKGSVGVESAGAQF